MPGSTPRDRPSPEEERIAPRPIGAASAVALLLASALSSALAPLVLADSYDWVRHTTSEAGGQGVEGAWLARGGFVLFGLAVLHVVGLNRERWHAMAGFCHRFFAVAMIAVAAFSLRSWEDGAAYDRIEDLLHSVAATAMGFAFAFGVAAVGSVIVRNGGRVRVLDVTAVVASVVLPLGMTVLPDFAGLLQRLMFAVAYAWYAREGLAAALRAAIPS